VISEVLKCNSTLTQLDLTSDEIILIEINWTQMKQKANEWIGSFVGVKGARMMSEGLKYNNALTELNLKGDGTHGIGNVLWTYGNGDSNGMNRKYREDIWSI